MPKAVIQLVGTLRYLFGCSEIEVEADGEITFRDLMKIASAEAGRDFYPHLCDPETGEIRPHIVIFVNGDNLLHLKGLDTPLTGSNEIVVMRADMAGG